MMIDIIGAGPAGLMAGFELAKHGRDVTVFEEHNEIGRPVQCTGIVTSELKKIVPLKKDYLVNRIKKANIISGKNSLTLPVDDLVIDRSRFDKYLAGKAEDAGVNIKLGTKVEKVNRDNITIGADGPNSIVAKLINPGHRMDYYVGKQAVVRGEFEPDTFKVFLGDVAPGFFAWIVPLDETTARIGLASLKDTAAHFDRFIKTQKTGKIKSYQGGLIPVFDPRLKTHERNMYVVGDAAGHVKATTGGGLVPGLACARVLADSIINNKDYDKEWRNVVGKELSLHLRIRKMMNNFSEKDYYRLIRTLRKEEKIFRDHNRDNIGNLIFRLLIRHPGLLLYLRRYF